MKSSVLGEFSGALAEFFPDITRWLESTYPEEGCGALMSNSESMEWIPMANVARERHTMFEMDPVALLHKLRSGRVLECVVHSHVNACSEFSDLDFEFATFKGEGGLQEMFPGARYLIISVIEGVSREATLHRFEHGRFVVEGRWDNLLAA